MTCAVVEVFTVPATKRFYYYYIADDGALVGADDLMDPNVRAMWEDKHERRRIGATYLSPQGEILDAPSTDAEAQKMHALYVSTVFLVIDHSFPMDDEPVLFETMVFNMGIAGRRKWGSDIQVRYHTIEEAREGHAYMVGKVQAWLEAHGSLEGFDEAFEEEEHDEETR